MGVEIKEREKALSDAYRGLSMIYNSAYYRVIHHPLDSIKIFLRYRHSRVCNAIRTKIDRQKVDLRRRAREILSALGKNKLFIKFYDSNNVLSRILQAAKRRHNRWLVTYKRHINLGETPPPLETLILMLTKRCNLKCDFCDIHDSSEEMRVEDAIKVIDNVKKLDIRSLVITGGEPFLHKDLFNIVRYAKSKALDVCVTTNGLLLLDAKKEIIDSAVDTLSISLDGLQGVHDQMRNKKGLFDQVWQGIEELSLSNCNLALNFVITNKNVTQLEKVYFWSKGRNLFLDFWPVNYCKDLYINKNGDYRELMKFIKKLRHNGNIRRC